MHRTDHEIVYKVGILGVPEKDLLSVFKINACFLALCEIKRIKNESNKRFAE